MARVKRSVNARKKRRSVLEQASGYRGQRSRLYRKAKEQVTHSGVYAFRDRRARKGDFRRLWIQRINAAARAEGLTYNRFIQGLGLAGVEVDRRMLAELAVNEPAAFSALVDTAREALPRDVNAPRACSARNARSCTTAPPTPGGAVVFTCPHALARQARGHPPRDRGVCAGAYPSPVACPRPIR